MIDRGFPLLTGSRSIEAPCDMSVDFSVIIPSRDRPALLIDAVNSVLRQTHASKEVIIVDDGTSGNNAAVYAKLEEELSGQAVFHHLVHRPRGHGQSYSINFGVSKAAGAYVCFLDDDDYWTDDDHLARAHSVIQGARGAVDAYFTNQHAFINSKRIEDQVWIEDLAGILDGRVETDAHGAYDVTVRDLMRSSGFCHLNTSIVRRDLFEAIGGMDEGIRWECDRDFNLRLIDHAGRIKYHPAVVSRHHVPDPTKTANMTTAIDMLQKRLFQVAVLDKAILYAKHEEIRRHGKRHKVYALKKIAVLLHGTSNYSRASYYAREALLTGFSIKWALFTSYLLVHRLFSSYRSWKIT